MNYKLTNTSSVFLPYTFDESKSRKLEYSGYKELGIYLHSLRKFAWKKINIKKQTMRSLINLYKY